MLDDNNIIKQRDPFGALQIAANQFNQTSFSPEIKIILILNTKFITL